MAPFSWSRVRIQQVVLKLRKLWPPNFDFPIYCLDDLSCNYLTLIFTNLVFSVLVLKVLDCWLLLCAFIYHTKTLTVPFIQMQDFYVMQFILPSYIWFFTLSVSSKFLNAAAYYFDALMCPSLTQPTCP